MAGTKLGSSGVVGDSNSPQVTSRLFTSGTETSGTTLPTLLWPALWAVGLVRRGSVVREINWSWCLRTTIPSSSSTRADRGPVSWMIVTSTPGSSFGHSRRYQASLREFGYADHAVFFCLDWAECMHPCCYIRSQQIEVRHKTTSPPSLSWRFTSSALRGNLVA